MNTKLRFQPRGELGWNLLCYNVMRGTSARPQLRPEFNPCLDTLSKSSTTPASTGGRALFFCPDFDMLPAGEKPSWQLKPFAQKLKKHIARKLVQIITGLSPIIHFLSSLRVRLVAVIFIAIAPALGLMFYTDLIWLGLLAGVLAIGATWLSGGSFVLRQIDLLLETTRRLSSGDFSTRTQLGNEPGELGELARAIDAMTVSLESQIKERERAEKNLLDRAHHQTVVAALGQFALTTNNLPDLLEQAVLLVSQTLEVEYCGVLEVLPDGRRLLLRAGTGWKNGFIGKATVDAQIDSPIGYAFRSGEPVIVADMQSELRFKPSSFLRDHGVISGINVAITGHPSPFGVLGVHSTRQRDFTEDEVHLLVAVATVITMAVEHERDESQLHKLAAFAQANPNPVLEFSRSGGLTYFNDAAAKIAEQLGAEHPKSILPADIVSIVQHCLATGRSKLRMETRTGSRTLSWSFFPVTPSNVVQCYVDDMTERLELEAQLRQSQKMESVGQLAAGVAHDFNNMLTVIQGHAGMILAKTNNAPELLDSAQAVYFAAERAANLTRQLLMFSRKNVMQLRLLDLKEIVSTMTKMLQRLLGETIALQVLHPDDLPGIQADPGMIEQVIMNLAVNARDAMLKGGTLTISTSLLQIDNDYKQVHPEARAGSFVCLRVSDTGCGMDSVTLNRIFEPFFTTKEVGKGTGLGLATAYGIVKQHDGWIEVASEPSKGTTFNVFFPAGGKPVKTATAAAESDSKIPGGNETILIVEDEPVLRDMAHLILQECGYKIFEASSGLEALSVWERHRDSIHLLLTDMVMPEGMTGKELAEKLARTKPDLKIIFTSGYSVEDLSHDEHCFLQKPYSRFSLAKTVRSCLDN